MQKEGSDCCSIDKLSNPINVGISLFFFNFALIMIDVYDIGVITLISYLALFAILFTVFHIKFMNFFYGKVEEKIEQCEPT